jgi:hypothetical protein
MDTAKRKNIIAWISIGISALFANFWAFWGINENFHEGWYYVRFWDNVLMMFGQYLLMPIGFMILALVSIKWNKIGALLHLLLAVGAWFLFGEMDAGFFLVVLPLTGLAILYWFGVVGRKRLAYVLVIGLPLLQILGIGTFHAVHVAGRYNDGYFGIRLIQGNDVALI